MITWPEVEAALQGRPGWRRVGREYHGPCPVTGAGKDGAWFGAGSGSGGVRCGCRHCGDAGGRLDGESLTAHLAAVAGVEADPVRTPAGSRPRAASTGLSSGELHEGRAGVAGLAAVVWRAGVEADGTPPDQVQPLRNEGPGAVYLHGRGAWVRRDRGDVGVNAAGEPVELAVDGQDPDGGDDGGGGSDEGGNGGELFDHDPDVTTVAGVNLAEGPIDALALATLAAGGIERRALGGRPIVGAAGVGGWRLAAVADWPGPVTLWVQADGPGYRAALRLEAALRHGGRAVGLEVAPVGMDWGGRGVYRGGRTRGGAEWRLRITGRRWKRSGG